MKFRRLGFIDYNGGGALTVKSGLLSVLLHKLVSISKASVVSPVSY